MQSGDQLRDDAKQLLRVAYERRAVDSTEGMQVDLSAAAVHRGLSPSSPQLNSLVDYMEVAGWVHRDPASRDVADNPTYSITARGLEVLREVPEVDT
jgi:hypothetical protein